MLDSLYNGEKRTLTRMSFEEQRCIAKRLQDKRYQVSRLEDELARELALSILTEDVPEETTLERYILALTVERDEKDVV